MQRTRRNACLLLLASSGLLPAEAFADPAAMVRMGHRERIEEALVSAQRTLRLERFLLSRLEAISDPGISPSYQEELEACRARVFEAEAWVRALERALAELAGPAGGAPGAGEAPQARDPALAGGPTRARPIRGSSPGPSAPARSRGPDPGPSP